MKGLTSKNIDRRYGGYCASCGNKPGTHKLTEAVNGKSVAFCSSKCCDDYRDKENANT